MSGFQFPPPPPPPPKASWTPDNQYHHSNPSARGRGGGRGRGRASDNGGRGRGGRGGNTNYQQPDARASSQHSPQQVATFNGLPPGAYINPAFRGNLNYAQSTSSASNATTGSAASPARTVAGHKRKLDALRGPPPPKAKEAASPTAPSVPSFGAPIGGHLSKAPSVADIPNRTVQRPQQGKRSNNVLGLTPNGEPQYSSTESEDEDDDVDEEAMFAEAGADLTFEHNGSVLSLKSAADLAAWKEERARNYPTRMRMAAKLEERRQLGAERKRLLLEASTAIRAAKRPTRALQQQETKLEKAKKESAAQTESLTALRKNVEKSQARLAQAKANAEEDVQAAEAKAQAEDLGLASIHPTSKPASSHQNDADIRGDSLAGSPHEHSQVDDAVEGSAQSSASSASSVISSDSSDSDDDGPPEEVSSKQSNVVSGTKSILCRNYVASGRCRDGDSCRFKHELPERGSGTAYRELAQKEEQERAQRRKAANDLHDAKLMESRESERKTIFQRLVEQEHVGEDLLALQVIKALGKRQFFAQTPNHIQDT